MISWSIAIKSVITRLQCQSPCKSAGDGYGLVCLVYQLVAADYNWYKKKHLFSQSLLCFGNPSLLWYDDLLQLLLHKIGTHKDFTAALDWAVHEAGSSYGLFLSLNQGNCDALIIIVQFVSAEVLFLVGIQTSMYCPFWVWYTSN